MDNLKSASSAALYSSSKMLISSLVTGVTDVGASRSRSDLALDFDNLITQVMDSQQKHLNV